MEFSIRALGGPAAKLHGHTGPLAPLSQQLRLEIDKFQAGNGSYQVTKVHRAFKNQ